MAHAYAHLFAIPCSGLRFFTVYGPWGSPDMALFLFTKAILEGRPINVFNFGSMRRDFTYIDDIAEGVVRVLDKPASRILIGLGKTLIQAPLQLHAIFTISAATGPWSSRIRLHSWRKRWGKQLRKTCCPCNPATFRLHAPRLTI